MGDRKVEPVRINNLDLADFLRPSDFHFGLMPFIAIYAAWTLASILAHAGPFHSRHETRTGRHALQ